MDQSKICEELDSLFQAIPRVGAADHNDLLERLNSVAQMAPDDAELKAAVQAGREHIRECQRLVGTGEQLTAQGLTDARVGVNSAYDTHAVWRAAYLEYTSKYCFGDAQI